MISRDKNFCIRPRLSLYADVGFKISESCPIQANEVKELLGVRELLETGNVSGQEVSPGVEGTNGGWRFAVFVDVFLFFSYL